MPDIPPDQTAIRSATPPKSSDGTPAVVRTTPIKETLSSPLGSQQADRVATFTHRIEYLNQVDDSELPVFKHLFDLMEHAENIRPYLENVLCELLASAEWAGWAKDKESKSSQNLTHQGKFFNVLTKAQALLKKSLAEINLSPRANFINIGNTRLKLDSDLGTQDKVFNFDIATTPIELDREPFTIGQYITIWEHKKASAMISSQQQINLSLLRAVQVMTDDPHRLFVYSIYVAGEKLKLYQINRGSIYFYANILDIVSNTTNFLEFISWTLFASDQETGINKMPSEIEGYTFELINGTKSFPSPLQIVQADILYSRACTIWPVRLLAHEGTLISPPRLSVLKLGWIDETRTPEHHFLQALRDVDVVPRVYGSRDGITTEECNPLHELAPKTTMKLPSAKFSTPTLSNSTKQTSEALSSSKKVPLIAASPPFEFTTRRQRYLLLEFCGTPVWTNPKLPSSHLSLNRSNKISEKERIIAIQCVAEGIGKLFDRNVPVIHRDLSPGNVMVTSQDMLGSDPQPPPGRLIDFDLAIFFRSPAPHSHIRTGTFCYMAIEVLEDKPFEHTPWHDLESLFWIIFFTELARTPQGEFHVEVNFDSVTRHAVLADVKSSAIRTDRWNGYVIEGRQTLFSSSSDAVMQLLGDIRKLLFVKEIPVGSKVYEVLSFGDYPERFGVKNTDETGNFRPALGKTVRKMLNIFDEYVSATTNQ
ncbi:MAG: hypothetical protein M1829_003121 [Trizodia sp. TS-e1964]|nr:MAG: hypothetical protein M1829_003121 [Trizodia sp. TS-e1964]